MIISIIKEYGPIWLANRTIYAVKLKLLKIFPAVERVFEKKVCIKKVDIYQANAQRIESFLKTLPETCQNDIVDRANDCIEGKIIAFSWMNLDYGNPINWHIHPITGVETDKYMKWFNIPDFDEKRGDLKIVWEASRFTHFFYLTRAYMITQEEKYYTAFSAQLKNWIDNNKYSQGANYKCGQEATIRMINALIAYSIFKAYGLTKERDMENLKELISGSYKKVLSNFFYAHKCIKNNHTISEITGLIIGAWCSEDDKRLKKAYQLLNKEIVQQFMIDGGYVQYSFNYQRLALQMLEFVIKISDNVDEHISTNAIELIQKSALQMYQVQDESGNMPNYGPNDGALLFPVTACDYSDFRPTINALSTIINGERLFEPGRYDEEILWFWDGNLSDIPIIKSHRTTQAFKHSGIYSFRHKEGFLMTIMNDYKSRPSHMNQMHLDLWQKGVNVFSDSGTYSYASHLGEKLSLTGAHNTIKVENKNQMNKRGPFLVYDWAAVKETRFSKDSLLGSMISPNDYWHTRRITQTEKGYIVEDTVGGDFSTFSALFHTPCSIKPIKGGIVLYNKDKEIARLLTENEVTINESERSLYYMKAEKTIQVSVHGNSVGGILTEIILT